MGEDQDVWSQVALFSSIVYSPRMLSTYIRCADNRACVDAPPEQECPFSTRLAQFAMGEGVGVQLKNDILKYCASHIISIAKLNIRTGNYAQAKILLRDARCWRKPVHKVWWEMMRWVHIIKR